MARRRRRPSSMFVNIIIFRARVRNMRVARPTPTLKPHRPPPVGCVCTVRPWMRAREIPRRRHPALIRRAPRRDFRVRPGVGEMPPKMFRSRFGENVEIPGISHGPSGRARPSSRFNAGPDPRADVAEGAEGGTRFFRKGRTELIGVD